MNKIVVAGIGGVGGFYGGLLAAYCENDLNNDVYFFTRGKNLDAISANGLTIIKGDRRTVARPALATDIPEQIGEADIIIICVKSYDLESTLQQLAPCIGKNTVVLPLLNGADISDRIRTILPNTEVWEGCVYIVARLIAPGMVEDSGNVRSLLFGSSHLTQKHLDFEKLLIAAGIEATCSDRILSVVWEKFIFISATATLTSFYDVGFADLVTDNQRKQSLLGLIGETRAIADAAGISIREDIVSDIIRRSELLPNSTSSMHSDFKMRKNTELSTLTQSVVELGKKYGIATPLYEEMLQALSRKQ